MKAKRIIEIEDELRSAIPNDVYDPSLEPVECAVCHGACDDHKANCYVPLVYELLSDAKIHANR